MWRHQLLAVGRYPSKQAWRYANLWRRCRPIANKRMVSDLTSLLRNTYWTWSGLWLTDAGRNQRNSSRTRQVTAPGQVWVGGCRSVSGEEDKSKKRWRIGIGGEDVRSEWSIGHRVDRIHIVMMDWARSGRSFALLNAGRSVDEIWVNNAKVCHPLRCVWKMTL